MAKKRRPTLDDLLKHVDYIADLVGIDHVGLGIDFEYINESMQEASKAHYEYFVKTGQWNPDDYPPPPYYYPQGLDDPRCFPNLTKALMERGYDEEETRKVLGGNFMRVYSQIWTVGTMMNRNEILGRLRAYAGKRRCHYRRRLQRGHCGQVRGVGRGRPNRLL